MKKLAVSAFCLAILSACGGSPNSDQAAVAADVEKAPVLVSGIRPGIIEERRALD